MRYTASSLTRAARPVVIAIGRVPYATPPADASRLARWWHRHAPHHRLARWWYHRAHQWTARPVSTPQMLALQAAGRDPVAYLLALAEVLHAVFPWRRRYLVTGNPVRRLLRLPDALRAKVLEALLTIPSEAEPVDDSPMEALRRAQRAQVYGAQEQYGPRPSLSLAALTVRAAYGEHWYFAPDRWCTSDGYAPFALTWVEYVGLQALDARRRLEIADGYAVAHAKRGDGVRRALEKAANPSELVS